MRFRQSLSLVLSFAALGCVAQAAGPQSSGSPSQFRVAGKVINQNGSSPLPQCRVTLREVKNPKNVRSALTGDDGRFEFLAPAGKYNLSGAKRGFITASYDQHDQFSSAIVTGADVEAENLVLKLSAFAMLSGRVLDETGEPVRRAQVMLWRQTHQSGVNRIVRFRGEMIDDLGGYEFAGLNDGTYFLSVSAQPWYAVHPPTAAQEGGAALPVSVDRSLDVVFPTTYYADATESDDATPILLGGGARVELELHMRSVPAVHFVFRHEQKPEGTFFMPLLQKRAFDGVEPQQSQDGVRMIGPGVAELTAAPGKYTVRLPNEKGNGQVAEVDLSQDHQEVEAPSEENLSNLEMTVKVSGEATPPRGIFLTLRDSTRTVAVQEVSGDGEAKFANVKAGTYEVFVGSPDGDYSVAGITVDGRETPGHTLMISPGVSLSLSLRLVEGSGSIEGFVRKAGQGVRGAMVVLIPKNPENNRDLFRRDQSDLDGSFVLRNVIPGTYTLVAIADGWDLDWSRAAVITKYATHGQRVIVPGQGKAAIQLREAVELQLK